MRDDGDNLWGDHFSGGFARKLGQGSSTYDVRTSRGMGRKKGDKYRQGREGGYPIQAAIFVYIPKHKKLSFYVEFAMNIFHNLDHDKSVIC